MFFLFFFIISGILAYDFISKPCLLQLVNFFFFYNVFYYICLLWFLQINSPKEGWSVSRLWRHSLSFLRIGFWALFFDFVLHYFYFTSLAYHLTVIQSLSQWTLVGIGYCQGQFFMVKYIIMWGVSSCIAQLDQFKPPKGPKCISHIYLYSEMWR